MAELETVADKRIVEEMVTAILAKNPFAQERVVAKHDLTEREERLVRSGASIISGMVTALGKTTHNDPRALWKRQLQETEGARLSRLPHDGETQRG